PDDRFGARLALQAAEQSARSLTAERRIRREGDDEVTGLCQRSADASHQCRRRSPAGWILQGEDHRPGYLADRADHHHNRYLLGQRGERSVEQGLAVYLLGQLVRSKALRRATSEDNRCDAPQ
ncbi:MAG TPA: hypothetical protein VHQ68_07595, partial [Propionibacteriaceae bacterium]|nr:hypothetical protein [Propionibacteriaceae bacterium]